MNKINLLGVNSLCSACLVTNQNTCFWAGFFWAGVSETMQVVTHFQDLDLVFPMSFLVLH